MIIKRELHHNLFVQLRTMEEAMRELFNKTTQMFVEGSAIHDLCSNKLGSTCKEGMDSSNGFCHGGH